MDYKIPFSSKRSSCTDNVLVLFYSLIKYKHFLVFFVLAKTIYLGFIFKILLSYLAIWLLIIVFHTYILVD